jgi:hypothetical protein
MGLLMTGTLQGDNTLLCTYGTSTCHVTWHSGGLPNNICGPWLHQIFGTAWRKVYYKLCVVVFTKSWAYMCIIIFIYYICIYVVGALRSIDESHIVFKPCIDGDLESYRLTLTPNLKHIRRQIRVFVRLRLKMGFYTKLRPTRLWFHEQGATFILNSKDSCMPMNYY